MKSRLKKLASSETEKMYNEIIVSLDNMSNMAHIWSVREVIRGFTTWDFYTGSLTESIDDETVKDIIQQVKNYVEEIRNDEELLNEIHDIVYRY